MNSWKKLLVLLLALVTVCMFAACNKEEPEETEPTLNPGDKNCAHVFTAWETIKENSCTQKGTQARECTECGKEEEKALLAYGHVYSDGLCMECGKEVKECQHPECDTVAIKDATCTEDGEVREVCKLCKAVVEQNYISAFWHPETETVLVREATCTENGVEHEVCKRCGEVVYEDTIWATGHQETENVVIQEATCTENGTYQDICKVCGEVAYEGTIWAYGHEYEVVDAKDPTCTEIGWKRYSKCIVCQYVSNYTERPATGHNYQFGVCTNCEGVDSGFRNITAPGLSYNQLVVSKPGNAAYDALDAKIELYQGEIKDRNTVDVFTFTAAVDGRYYIWLQEIYSGYNIGVWVKNALGETVDYDYHVYNNEGMYLDLAAGTYTVELKYGSGNTTYQMYVGHAKALPDITAYDVVNDKMEYNRQTNKYTFTASVSGVYLFYLSDMLDNAQMPMAVYNRLNERIAYNGYISNGKGLTVTLEAGEVYTLHIENANNKLTPYTLRIGKQKPRVVLDGQNIIKDAVTFKGQVNVYQFVATGIDCRIDVVDMISGMQVNIELYNRLNERVAYYNYCDNGEGFNYSKLVSGETYTVKVTQSSELGDYTLRVLSPKAMVEVTEQMAVADKMEYSGQVNNYTITAGTDGELVIRLRVDSYTNDRCLSFYVYDSQGNQVSYDNYVYDGDTLTIKNAVAGETYILRVTSYNGTMEYAISFT